MPALNWGNFTKLPGSAEKNFELLCRGIVRQNFASYGDFRALANQPGVEFHIKLDKPCVALGDAGRWWGWQCKWYELSANGRLGTTRRAKIEEGIRKTEIHVPDLTDWVLWTRRTLTKDDQKWFDGLSSKMKLHQWTEDEVDNFLGGQAAYLRSTYFGELVLTPDILREIHEQAVAPIRARWQPQVHHVGDAERDLRRMLGELESWSVLSMLSADLLGNAEAIEASPSVPSPLALTTREVVEASRRSSDTLDRLAESIHSGDLDLIRDELSVRPHTLPESVVTAPRRLRAGNHRAGLYATNAVAGCHDTIRVLGDVEDAFSSRVVAVLAPAGCGKTHLAAQLTSETTTRPHGVLLHGRELHSTHSLDDLARRVSIAAQPVPNMESLLAAMDAAGQRARHRLPLFIDGLNESEDPRTWKPLLASLNSTLAKYPYVLLVCTLRPEFAEDALPNKTRCIEIQDYGADTIEAIREHFEYWKIDATDTMLPEFLRHPLTLRIFCEVTNPTRKQVVGVSAMPGSLTALFERYLEQVAERVVELAPRAHRFYAQDVNVAISTIANMLWDSRYRSIDIDELRQALGDEQRPWDQSIVRALEYEGVLLRTPSTSAGAYVPAYDLLGGHIIASALLARHGQLAFESWLKTPSTMALLSGDYNVRHPLAEDVVLSLVGQVPRRFHARQFWQMVDEEPLRGHALRSAAHLEPAFLDVETVDALLELVRNGDAALLEALWKLRGQLGHPLNAEGLDQALRTMTVADRDLQWTEWLRRSQGDILSRGNRVIGDIEKLEQRWKSGKVGSGERLRARWVMWTLTSTVRHLRDQATRSLYWFGRFDPEGLFRMTIDSLTVNDAYVSERMLAASYGVVMSHQLADADFAPAMRLLLEQLVETLVGVSASAPTHHFLTRLYVRGIIAFAAKFYPSTLPNALSDEWSFATPTPIQPLTDDDEGAEEAGLSLHMDFENYTLGRLFDDRRNYDMAHEGHKAAVAHVRGVVWDLGWREATFKALDLRIADDSYRYGRRGQPIAERYGKKYGWVGYYTYAGLLDERGQFPQKYSFSDIDIDPSFPEKPSTDGDSSVSDAWLSPTVESDKSWVCASATPPLNGLLRRETIGEHHGPWLAVHGFVIVADRILGREAWAFISAFVTDETNAPLLRSMLRSGTLPWGSRDVPSDHYTFAGEIPWHPKFASTALMENAYFDEVAKNGNKMRIQLLAHEYAWEGRHSETNRAGTVRIPSRPFSDRFDLRNEPQSFDQVLPDGSRAAITLSGVDGLDADIVYVREDLIQQYIGEQSIVWSVFGERGLRPYPPSPPKWLLEAHQEHTIEWREVLTISDI